MGKSESEVGVRESRKRNKYIYLCVFFLRLLKLKYHTLATGGLFLEKTTVEAFA